MTEVKKNLWINIKDYFRSVWAELKKVNWPGRKMVTISTIVIILIVFFVMIFVGVVDYVFTKLVTFLAGIIRG